MQREKERALWHDLMLNSSEAVCYKTSLLLFEEREKGRDKGGLCLNSKDVGAKTKPSWDLCVTLLYCVRASRENDVNCGDKRPIR
jgi:hypothetical protein